MDWEEMRRRRPFLERRAALFHSLRDSLERGCFLEVETETAIAAPAPEEYIEAIAAGDRFLRTSPELAMKILLTAGYSRIYQIGRCFRADEYGRKHRSEFTMLEFYAAAWDYRQLADYTFTLITDAAQALGLGQTIPFQGDSIDLAAGPEWITVTEAFQRWTDTTADEATQSDLFDELMVTRIEPNLGRGRVTFLADYPANRASLARLRPDDPTRAERWEIYIGGIELGNAYGELTHAAEQRRRFAEAVAFRQQMNMLAYPEPDDFYAALEQGMPACSGVAIGLDRLAMVFCDTADIADVRAE
ncbi:MAG: EF-P lysine aminoacylase GenX [Lentisphaeria bacterium]|nr:EF-P lysine aminoacylase GenX [Lentisphaeria bacterium]